jgi:hypothetical protein
VHKRVEEVRRGEKLYDPSETGGTQIDSRFRPSKAWISESDWNADPGGGNLQRFVRYYREELREQFRGVTKK